MILLGFLHIAWIESSPGHLCRNEHRSGRKPEGAEQEERFTHGLSLVFATGPY